MPRNVDNDELRNKLHTGGHDSFTILWSSIIVHLQIPSDSDCPIIFHIRLGSVHCPLHIVDLEDFDSASSTSLGLVLADAVLV